MELFFDTETTGLPLFKEPATHPKQPDVIQLACILSDEETIYASLCCILNPSDINEDWSIHPMAAAAHGISEEIIRTTGIDTKSALDLFLALLDIADTLVCHNVTFDKKLIMGAMFKAGYGIDHHRKLEEGNYYCTMTKSTDLCKIPKKNGYGYKWPKLMELYKFLFNEEFEGAHDALADVKATRRCYYELKRRGL